MFYCRNLKIELVQFNDATNADLKEATGVDITNLATISDLASLNAEINKTYKDKFKTVPGDSSKLCNVLDNDVAKKSYLR